MVSARVSHLQVSLGLANHASILRSSLAWTWLVSRDPQRRGFFLIGQVAFQQCFEFVDVLIAPTLVDDGHADRHKVDRLRIRTLAAGSATAGRSLDGAVGQVTGNLASVVVG